MSRSSRRNCGFCGRAVFGGALAAVLVFSALHARAFDAASRFETSCSGCHAIGGGDAVGPDLKGVTDRRSREWLVPFIRSSQTAIGAGDPAAVELFEKFQRRTMPDQELTADEVDLLLDFIAGGGIHGASSGAQSAAEAPAGRATADDVARGRDLFLGKIRTANGSPPCFSCHRAGDLGELGGGTLGVDLTQVYSRYGDVPLSLSLKKPGFRVMKEIFAAKPLTDDEAFALKAFLYEVDRKGAVRGDERKKFLFLGIGGAALSMGVIDFLWRKRRKVGAKPWMRRSGGAV